MITMTGAPEISGPQRKFLISLVVERDWSLADMTTVRVAKIVMRRDKDDNLPTFVSKKDASTAIDALLKKCPKIVVAPTAAPAGAPVNAKAAAQAAIADLPGAYKGIKYAVPNTDPKSSNPWVFYEVKEYKGAKYLNRLQGAPGTWHRIFVKYADYAGIAQRIKDMGAKNSAFKFSEIYTVCACCGSPLSNGKSIAEGFGPVCIKKF